MQNQTQTNIIDNSFPNEFLISNLDKQNDTIHFIGIGGIGMSGLAKILLEQGYKVTGSDKTRNELTDKLESLGAKIFFGHNTNNIQTQKLVIVSTAITIDNPEFSAAKSKNIEIWHRSRLLRSLANNKKLIAVSGTHGKTTTTGMIASILMEANLDPSIVVGGYLNKIESNARLGNGQYFVAEIDESDKSHIDQTSYISVITNIEEDHLENYPKGITEIYDAMITFANKSDFKTIICNDNPGCKAIQSGLKTKTITYGLKDSNPDFYYISNDKSINIFYQNQFKGSISLKVPGQHNKLNAMAAIAVAFNLNISFEYIKIALENFGGVNRRFQIKGEVDKMLIVDDYAHHPTEVESTIKAAREFIKQNMSASQVLARVVVIFQPHQPKRLQDLFNQFVKCFDQADLVIICDVYIARGKEIPQINSRKLVEAINKDNVVYYAGDIKQIIPTLKKLLKPSDLVITMGAGNITDLGDEIIESW